MIKDQWVPCSPEWLAKFPGACAEAPRRPGRQQTGVSHYHLEDNPSIKQLAKFTHVPLPSYLPRHF